ncbi:nitrate reductase molybdenum cofactor assembly chaperone [Gorillibacterium massiliense]|uniref:nitrate reductase molybdenum cofactor assembly chaperone n=1 Tax=Gorillibacterium massiliense TaxID=1280390 RepID=UPI0004AF99BC|nr:nitrate reductase molybdenum cofactor assembly chaperone [Gorillibacterium massiliense]
MNETTMRSSLMMFSFLLQYPDHEWLETADERFVEWSELLEESDGTAGPFRDRIAACLAGFAGMDGETITAQYVKTFDFSKKTNLYLTYNQLGEERERGPALLQLKDLYEEEDLVLSTEELPDYLPLVLEYAAVAEKDKGAALLVSFRKALEGIQEALSVAESPYHHVLSAILHLLDKSGVAVGSFHFEVPQGCAPGGTVTGCGPMWAAAGYGGGPADPSAMKRNPIGGRPSR